MVYGPRSVSIQAVIFDLGGVVFPSPFEAFDEYDHGNGLEKGTLRAVIRRSSEEGAWAALERGELSMDEFADALEAEADTAGIRLDARKLMALIGARLGPRPEMARAIAVIKEHGLKTAALTNNWRDHDNRRTPRALDNGLDFDVVVESARRTAPQARSRASTRWRSRA